MADSNLFGDYADLVPQKQDSSAGSNQFGNFADLVPKAPVSQYASNPTVGRDDVLPVGEKDQTPPPVDPDAGKRSGLIANAAAGTNEGIAGTLGFPVDASTYLLNRAYNAVRASLPGGDATLGKTPDLIQHPFGGSETFQDAISALDPEADPTQVVARTPMEQGVRGIGAMVAGLPVPGATAEMAARAPSAAMAAVRPAARAVSNYVQPLTQAGREQIAANQLASGATDRFAAADALNAPDQELVPGSQPTTGQLTGDLGILGQERRAETANPEPFIQRRADQNQARVDALGNVQQGGNAADVPSLFRQHLDTIDQNAQQALDQATAQAQAQKDAAQANTENVTAAAGVMNENAANNVADAERQALAARSQLPQQQTPPEQVGASIRQPAVDARQSARDQENALYDAAEKFGPLQVDGTPVRERANDILSGLGPSSPPLSGEEKLIFDRATSYPDDASFKDLGQLRSWIASAARSELQNNGRTVQWGRLSRLQGAVETAQDNTLQRTATQQAAAVDAGTLTPEQTVQGALQDHIAAQTPSPAEAPVTPAPVEFPGTVTPQPRQPSPYGPRVTRPPDLIRWIAQNGGIAPSPELSAIGLDKKFIPGAGPLIRPNGMSHDDVVLRANEAQYPVGDTPSTLYDALDTNNRGGDIFSANDTNRAVDWRRQADARKAGLGDPDSPNYVPTEDMPGATDINTRAAQLGITPHPNDTPEDILAAIHEREGIMADGATADSHADLIDKEIQERFGAGLPEQRDHVSWDNDGNEVTPNQVGGQPQAPVGNAGPAQATPDTGEAPSTGGPNPVPTGGAQAAAQGNGVRPPAGPVAPQDLTPEAVAARQAAAAATKARIRTYDRGAVGQILQPGETADQFKMPDYKVPGTVFHPGDGSFQKIEALRSASGAANVDPILRDYAASDLRAYAMKPDGTLDPNKIFTWQKSHADALRAFPDLQSQSSEIASAERGVPEAVTAQKAVGKQTAQDVVEAAKAQNVAIKQADQAISDAATARRQAMEDYQKGAAGRILGLDSPDDVTRTIGSIFGTTKANASMKELSNLVGQDQAGRQGVRQAIADYISGKFVGNTEVGASGTTGIKSDQLQTFLRKNQGPLSYWFSPDEIESMNNIAADLQRSNRSNVAMKLPARSNTAQDQAANMGAAKSFLNALLTRTSAEGLVGLGALGTSGLTGGVTAGTGILIGRALTSARDSGLATANKLVEQALLDPALAKSLLAKVPVKMGSTEAGKAVASNAAQDRLAAKLAGLSMFRATPTVPQGRKFGGSVNSGFKNSWGDSGGNIVARLRENGINP